jgi:hypothetical protein
VDLINRLRLSLLVAVVLTTIGVLGLYPGGTSAAQAASDVGYRDFSFSANSVDNPTGEKPQSKLWFNDGTWWASMFNRTVEEYHIYRYDRATHAWSDTGTLIDERNSSKADTLWDGKHLYVATVGPQTANTSHAARILRYSYDPTTKSYTLDPGFPVTITSGGLETIVLDKDTTGKLWVTYTQTKKVYVNRTLSNDQTWGTPFVVPVKGTSVTADDISAVVAFDSQIGVMWSNQVDSAMYFATHVDGDPDNVWQGSRTAIQGPNYADDHISLRSLQAADSSGRVFAAVKTSLNDLSNPNPNAPLALLLVRDRDGNWTNHVFGRVGDNHTRPIVMLDEEHRDLYMFATAPCCTGGAIYYKKTSLNNVSFSDGLGTPFIQSPTDTSINDATSTKQNVSSATGLMVMASSGTVVGTGGTGSGYYWHNIMDLGAADTVAPTVGGVVPADGTTEAAATSNVEATFSEAMDPATISGSTFTLAKQGSSQSVTATVSYDAAAKKATLDPSTELDPGATYAATVKGGFVGVKDLAGNPLVVDKSWSFSTAAAPLPPIDITAPETAIDSGPSGTINVADATFTFSASEAGASFECSLDGEAYAACTSPRSYINLSDGSHALQVRATDAAGNTDTTPANYTWAVDTTAPTLSGVTPADGATNVTVADNIQADFSEAVDVSTINGSTFTLGKQGSGQSVTATVSYDAATRKAKLDPDADLDPSATYTAVVKGGSSGVKDSAGNPLAGDTAWSFTTAAPPPPDTTPPETTIDSGPSGTLSSSSASFTFSSNETGGTFWCKLDAGTFAACTTPKTYDGLSNGSHTLEVRATDAAGNTDATPASRTWMVDTTAPVVQPPTHNFVENDILGASTVPVKLTWSATDDSGVAGYQLQQSTDGGASYQGVALPSGTATTITRSLTPGATSYQFRVRAQDQGGNWSNWTSGARFGVGAYQESDAAINNVGLWTTQTDSAAYGGALKYANGLGTEKATFVFTGSEVGWVSSTNQSRGQADVYLDGTKVATVDLYSASGKSRALVFSKGGLDPLATHTLEVRALGTRNAAAKSKRVDLDAFVVLR